MTYRTVFDHTVRSTPDGKWELCIMGVVTWSSDNIADCYSHLAEYAFRCALSAGATITLPEA